MHQKKFKDSANTAVFTTKFVLQGKGITIIYHNKDDATWQFFSNDYFENFEDVAKIVGLGQIVEMDSSVLEIADLPEGYRAYREFKGGPWTIEKNDGTTRNIGVPPALLHQIRNIIKFDQPGFGRNTTYAVTFQKAFCSTTLSSLPSPLHILDPRQDW